MSEKALIEAALFASNRSLTLQELAQLVESGNLGAIRKTVEELAADYKNRGAGIEVVQIGEGYLMRVAVAYEDAVMPLVPETDMPQAVLKTLALIAYEQPVLQSEVVKIRGDAAYKYIRFLVGQGLVEAKKEGRSKSLTTTPKFKEYFKIEHLKDMVSEEKA